MISHDRRCIFIHIPKTGGTSIEDAIWPKPRREEDLWMGFVAPGRNKYQPGGLQHLLARQVRLEVGADVFARYFKFAIIRNERWNLAIRTSMNLNPNPRLENFEISDDAELAGFFSRIVENVFKETKSEIARMR